ncbi:MULTISPECIES: porin [unclassified Vibrio]|uniref:porin n=1 Tax=unclassified Vibrio TaxID=2614977 RepID=UPI00354CE788
MKKTLLALAVMTAAGSVSAAEIFKTDEGSVDFYGQLRTELKISDDTKEYAYDQGTDMFVGTVKEGKTTIGAGSSRAGVDAKYALNDDLDIIGKVEFSTSSGEMKIRQHILGFAGDFGSIKIGQQWTVADDIYGADYSYFYGGSALGYSQLNGALHDSLIKYNYNSDNFFVAANYGLDENDSNQELAEIFVGGSAGDLSGHVGFGQTTDETGADKVEDTYYQATVEYSFGKAGIGFTYYNTEIKNSEHKVTIDGISLAGTYAWADNATAYAGYEYTDQDTGNISVVGEFGEEDTSTVIYVGTDYHFNSWSRIYVEAAYLDGRTLGFTNKESDSFVNEPTIADGALAFATGVRVYW